MFENSSIMIITSRRNQNDVFRLEVDAETQTSICNAFLEAKNKLTQEKNRIVFDGSYKPLDDELLAIERFEIPDYIVDALKDPLGLPTYKKLNDEFPEIKAVFVGEYIELGESFNIAFQRFRKEQYISPKWYNLFFEENTFFQEKRFGISISDNIDCFYTNGELQFSSFYYARQVFDLSNYYRSATDQEISSFVENSKLSIDNTESFKGMADTWVRRKIAMINDSKVLDNFSVAEIKRFATSIDVDINTERGKIVIPNDKEKIKIILGFLDEEAYKGPFSRKTYLANSKRQI